MIQHYGHIEGKLTNYGTIRNYSANTIKITVLGSENTSDGEIIDDGNDSHLWIAGSGSLTNNGTINQKELTVDAGTVTGGGTLTNAGTVTVTDKLTNSGTITNNANLYLQGANMTNSGVINGDTSKTTTITGKLDSSSGSVSQLITIGSSSAPNGELKIKAGNIGGAVTNYVNNGLILIAGSNETESTLTKDITGTGSVKIDTTGTVYGNSAIKQAVNVAAGIFDNKGANGYITGDLTIFSGAAAKNSSAATSGVSGATTLANVINNGIFELSNGTVSSITNKASGSNGVTQTGGTVETVVNGTTGTGAAAGKYTISKGKITTSITNNNTNSTLEISGATTGENITEIELVTNTLGSVTQSGGVVKTAANAGSYEISDGKISTEITNTKDLTVSGSADVKKITNKASGSNGVTQTGGTVETVVNGTTGTGAAAGKYTISKGQITTSITNNNTNSTLAISGDTTGANITQIALVTNTLGSVTQSGGVVTSVDNYDRYTQSGGNVGTAVNSKTYGISGGKITTSITNDNTNSALTVSGGEVALLNNNYGKTTQSGGTVTAANNSATYNLENVVNNTTTKFTQSASTGELNIYEDAKLEIGSGSSITDGTINLGKSGTSASVGQIKFKNSSTNSAKIVTQGASQVDIEAGTSFTTKTGTNIANDAIVTIASTGILNDAAGTVELGSNDSHSSGNGGWEGTVNVYGTGILNLNGVTQTSTAKLKQNTASDTTSVINVTQDQTLNGYTEITNGKLYLKNSGTELTLQGTSNSNKAVLTTGATNAYVNIALPMLH